MNYKKKNILVRDGKSIIFNKHGINFQKPIDTIELLSAFIEKKSKILAGNEWFGDHIPKEIIKMFIKKYFTIVWLRFFKLQIPFLIRHREVFRDLETWIVWGNIALSHQYHLYKALKENLINENLNYENYYTNVQSVKIIRGINASSISDISNIPRATVIRKLKWLARQEIIKKDKNLEYTMKTKGKLNKKINSNFKLNQIYVAEFLTDIFDYMKNSNFRV